MTDTPTPEREDIEAVHEEIVIRLRQIAFGPYILSGYAREKAEEALELMIRTKATRAGSGENAIDIVLHCPECGLQHVDEAGGEWDGKPWENPPHKSHLCHGCGLIWRPSDVPTNGVRATATVGKADTWNGPPEKLTLELRATSDDALTILTTALYDAENTSRLSEHPEDVPAYRPHHAPLILRRGLRVDHIPADRHTAGIIADQ